MFLSPLIPQRRSPTAKACGSALVLRDWIIILLFGGSLYLIGLGDSRVLTRHEVFAAQPAREMIQYGGWRWIVPELAGSPRIHKPPGMMWLIAAAIFVFRNEAEWVARLPSVLALLAISIMIATLGARWFGRRIGLIAGLLQLTFLYALIQARLSEADMALAATVCGAMFCYAIATIDSPRRRDESWRPRLAWWLCIAAAFLLKGPIGPLFVALSLATFAIVRRRGHNPQHDFRDLKFLLYPPGILICLALILAWPLLAIYHMPDIYHDWFSQMAGAASGAVETDPWYYYFLSIPEMLLPWTPIIIIGLWRGPSADGDSFPSRPDDEWLRRHMSDPRQRSAFLALTANEDRQLFWRYILCWFLPPIIFLTVAMKMKHYHYPIPAMLPLSIPAALGAAFYVNFASQWKRDRGLLAIFFLAACLIAAIIVLNIHSLPWNLRQAILAPIAIVALTGVVLLYFEHASMPRAALATWLIAAWAVAVSVRTAIVPLEDEFRPQTQFARTVNGQTPPGVPVFMLGDQEEDQEAQYAYYLRFPMQRLSSVDDLIKWMDNNIGQPAYAIIPAAMVQKYFPQAAVLTQYASPRNGQIEQDHVELVRISN